MDSFERRKLEAKRRAKKQAAIKKGIIFALLAIVIILAILLVFKNMSGGSDDIAPVIKGAKDITVSVGDTISYKSGVIVTDDSDDKPKLTVDSSKVDISTAGTYEVTYIAEDKAGNRSEVKINVIVQEKANKPEKQPNPENKYGDATDEEISQMKYLAGLYLKQIVKDDMSLKEKALRIWLWVNWNCDYVSKSDKSNWVRGAIQYFDTHKGDCFNYYAASKALLLELGVETVDIYKSDTSHSAHYWLLVNLGDGYYHFDATPRDGSGDFFFLVTDKQIDDYSAAHENSHIFDHSLYPASETKEITGLDDQPDYYDYFDE